MSFLEHASFVLGLSIAAGTLAWAAVSDFTRFLIPNWVSMMIAAAYPLAALGMPFSEWMGGLCVGILAFGLGFMLFARGLLGGGDVKLAAAVCLWIGPTHLVDFATATAATAVGLGVLMLSPVRAHLPRPAWDGLPEEGLQQPMPFGVALAAGGLWVLARRLLALA